MSIKNNITDPTTGKQAHIFTPFVDETNPPNGLTVYSEPRKIWDGYVRFFTNPTQGVDMNINASSTGGTNELVYNENAGASTEWDATNIVDNEFDFGSTTHAHSAIVTIVDYTALSGDTITINGTNITNTTVTEGVDWTAATSNNATATSLASALDGVSGVSASATDAVVTVIADASADITTFTESDAVNSPATALSIDASSTGNNDRMLLDRDAGTIALSSYVSVSGWIYVTSWSTGGTLKDIELQIRTNGTNTGNLVNLSSYIDIGLFNVWQNFNIPLADLGLLNESIDQITITTRDQGAGAPPNYFLDQIELPAIGGAALGPQIYTIQPGAGLSFRVLTIRIFMADAYAGTVANGTMPSLPYDGFLGVPSLSTGIVIQARRRGEIVFSGTIKQLSDFLTLPNTTIDGWGSDGTNSWMTMQQIFDPVPFPLFSSYEDNMSVTLNDNLAGLLNFRMSARVLIEKTS